MELRQAVPRYVGLADGDTWYRQWSWGSMRIAISASQEDAPVARIVASFDRQSPATPGTIERAVETRVVELDAGASIGEQLDKLMQAEKQRTGVR